MNSLRTIIVDDMRLIRTELKDMLDDYPVISIVGEASNADEAFQLISDIKPDVVFLDIHLPGLSGFDLLDKLNVDFKLIFISAFYNKYSNDARKYNPVEFLMKPISRKKLSRAIKKLQIICEHISLAKHVEQKQ